MKKTVIIILSLALLVLASCATTSSVDFTSLQEGVKKVIEVEGASQDELFVKANNWAVSAFSNADSVIEFSDKESGTITGKYYLRYHGNCFYFWAGGDVAPWTLIQVEVKEGKARISLKLSSIDFYDGNGAKTSVVGGIERFFVDKDEAILKAKWESLIADFEKALKAEADEW
jgi:uncharacterized protein YacL (UPF0231 family)